MTYAIIRNRGSALVSMPERHGSYAVRRVFDNSQIIERFEKWLLICGKTKNTRIAYIGAARQFAKFLDKPLTAATKEDVRAFVGQLYAKGFAATTIQARLDALRVLGDCLQLGGQVRASAPRSILRRKVPKRLPHAISEEEIEKLIAAARTPRDLAILELGYASGLRVSELANLRVEDLNLRARTLIVREGKGGNDRLGLFGRPAACALRAYLGNRTTGFLFQPLPPRGQCGGVWWDKKHHIWFGQWRETDATGKRVMRTVRLGDYELPNRERARIALHDVMETYLKDKLPQPKPAAPAGRLTTRQIRRIITDTAKRAGIKRVHPHVLRHSCATHCLNHGMDIRYVQEMLGHETLSTTAKYLHISTANLKQVHEKFFPGEGV